MMEFDLLKHTKLPKLYRSWCQKYRIQKNILWRIRTAQKFSDLTGSGSTALQEISKIVLYGEVFDVPILFIN
jgi:hypothetical protein